MKTKKIYCERGAWRRDLKNLESEGKIEIVTFPYEGRSKKTPNFSSPSLVTCDSTYLTFDMTFRISDSVGSEMYDQIRLIVGKKNEMDVRHIDAAYKSQCQAFLTPDKKDIISKKVQLEKLLNMKFFHSRDDWGEFVKFIE
ncbi:MAG: hypothetical protein Q8M08_15705 [Bacteroidales bacterium]|nr:hypothetical protein [Bacteroidales bacterium]